jgi:hypothetical protein
MSFKSLSAATAGIAATSTIRFLFQRNHCKFWCVSCVCRCHYVGRLFCYLSARTDKELIGGKLCHQREILGVRSVTLLVLLVR